MDVRIDGGYGRSVRSKVSVQVEPEASEPEQGARVQVDADLREASEDVDATLLAWSLSLSPLERLRAASRAASALGKFRHVPSEAS